MPAFLSSTASGHHNFVSAAKSQRDGGKAEKMRKELAGPIELKLQFSAVREWKLAKKSPEYVGILPTATRHIKVEWPQTSVYNKQCM